MKKLSFWLLGLYISTAIAAPQIKMNSPLIYDFGTVNQNEIVEHTFEFRNTGDDTLKILHVKSSCGCTAAMVSQENLAPNETGHLKATFNTKNRSGTQQKSILIESNDPNQPFLQVKIKGKIVVPYDIEPNFMTFREMKSGSPSEAQVLLINHTDKPLKLGEPQADMSELDVTLSQTTCAPGDSIIVKGHLPAMQQRNRPQGTIRIPVIKGSQDQLEFRVIGFYIQ
jgi:hypothetical protein